MWSRGLSFCTNTLSVCARLKTSFSWSLENMLTDRTCCPTRPWLLLVMDGTYRFGLLSLLGRTVLHNGTGDTQRAPACSFMYSFKSISGVRWLPVLMFVSHSSFEYISGSKSTCYVCYRIKDSDQTDASWCPPLVKTLPFHGTKMFNIQVFCNVTSCHRDSSPQCLGLLCLHFEIQAVFLACLTLAVEGTMIFENNGNYNTL